MRYASILLFACACSGGGHQVAIGPPPPKQTTGTYVGSLCDFNGICKCRDANAAGDGGVGAPEDASHKRYEIRLGPSSQELWATIHGAVMYKSAERAEACWYVDLPIGDEDIELRASAPSGVSAAWSIAELGAQTRSWYDTLHFNCGSPGVCGFDDLDGVKSDIAAHRVRDLCGSTKIKGLTWDTGKAPDQLHPSELAVHVHLEIYKRVPDKQHGDDSCGKYTTTKAPAAGE